MAGHLLGTGFGFLYRSSKEYTFSQGVFCAAAAGVGSLVGFSVPLIARSHSNQSYIIAGIIGAWGGLILGEYLTKSIFETSDRDSKSSKVNISIPIAYQWPLLLKKSASKTGISQISQAPIELVKLSMAF
jgi:hypothetical protein